MWYVFVYKAVCIPSLCIILLFFQWVVVSFLRLSAISGIYWNIVLTTVCLANHNVWCVCVWVCDFLMFNINLCTWIIILCKMWWPAKVSSVKKLKDFCRWFLGKCSYQHLHSSKENFVIVVSMLVTRICAVGFCGNIHTQWLHSSKENALCCCVHCQKWGFLQFISMETTPSDCSQTKRIHYAVVSLSEMRISAVCF